MSIEGCALQILRAAGVHPNQLTMLLHQFGGRLPSTEAEYQALLMQVRHQGHIHEASPGNIATILQGPLRQARPNAYFTGGQQQQSSHWTGFETGRGQGHVTPDMPFEFKNYSQAAYATYYVVSF